MITLDELHRYIDEDEDQQENLHGLAEMRGLPYKFLYSKGIIAVPDLSIINYMEHVLNLEDADLGITDSNINQFNDGFLIPVWDGYGNLIMWVNWNGERSSKYINIKLRVPEDDSTLYDKVKLFGMESLEQGLDTGVMFVTEGVFDTLTLQALKLPATAILGSSTMDFSKTFYTRFQQVYYLRDMDSVGYSAWVKFSKRVPNAKLIELPNLDYDGKRIKDINDFVRLGQTSDYGRSQWEDFRSQLDKRKALYSGSRFK